jgi:iduronate 2-sulfatase
MALSSPDWIKCIPGKRSPEPELVGVGPTGLKVRERCPVPIHPMIRTLPALAFALLISGATCLAAPAAKLNVLFLAVDDLRPVLGCYGDPLAQTPNIDRLAASGVRFDRAYCQQAVCAPSRNTLMTGIRPESLGVHDLATYFRTKRPDAVTLPEHFKAHGYTTARFGKLFHTGHGNQDDARSWTGAKPTSADVIAAGKKNTKQSMAQKQNRPPAAAPEVDRNALADGENTTAAIAKLRELKDTPFFLALGFIKPHLPFVAPKSYWDQFDRARFAVPKYPTPPANTPRDAFRGAGELLSYAVKQEELNDDKIRELIHGYYAATSYIDAQAGRILAELDRLGLAEKTIVVFWSDHGFQLGEHGQWAKHNNTELSARIPLIVRAPGKTKAGANTRALVETVDLYPTLSELAGLPARAELEGTSFAPLLSDPTRAWKSAAFSVWPVRERNVPGRPADAGLGRSMRTARYRFTEWGAPGQGELELYDHDRDPEEHINLAADPSNAMLVAQLRTQLHAGWRAAKPRG